MMRVRMRQPAAAAEQAASETAQQPYKAHRQCSREQVRLRSSVENRHDT
jgi:hypothetical protein